MSSELKVVPVLILGAGIAGATAALRLADAGVDVLVVTKTEDPLESNTGRAQGGIVAVADPPELLREDLLRAGDGLNYLPAVEVLIREGPRLVRELLVERWGVPLDRTETGELALTREASHSQPRIAHAADATGAAIARTLVERLQAHPRIQLWTGHTAVDLITPAHHSQDRRAVHEPLRVVGAYLLDGRTGQVRRVLARKTLLATGGVGQLFLHTTNPPGATGDGLALAYRAGARVIHAEYVQFHPTAFYDPRGGPPLLISETVRGEGARLVHADGTPFMEAYDPEWKDLAPRDVVARAIHWEMLHRNVPCVYLDLYRRMDAERIRARFPTLYAACLERGVDITREPIPVVPAAHYHVGGVWVDLWGRTSLLDLYAAGEVSCTGVHGANRLASTSLLEGLVWGWRAAGAMLEDLEARPPYAPELIPPWKPAEEEEPDPALIRHDQAHLRHIMWHYVGLVRSRRRLERALAELQHLRGQVEAFYRRCRLTPELVSLRHQVLAAWLIARAAWQNRESRGCHYRVS